MKFRYISRSILASLTVGMPVFGENKAGIPATGVSQVDVAEMVEPPTPAIVRLVGQTSPRSLPYNGFPHTVAVDVPVSTAAPPMTVTTGSPTSIPENARWPDANDRLVVAGVHNAGATVSQPARNPWVPVAPRNSAKMEIVFACGGTICSGGAECVGIVNGRIVRKGSAFNPFVVSLVTPQAVVLNYAGELLVIPRGRRVTVEH